MKLPPLPLQSSAFDMVCGSSPYTSICSVLSLSRMWYIRKASSAHVSRGRIVVLFFPLYWAGKQEIVMPRLVPY